MAIEKVYGVLLMGRNSLECPEFGFIGKSKREVKKYAEQLAAKLGILHDGKVDVAVENGWTEPLKKGFVRILQEHQCMEDIMNYTDHDVEFGDGFVVIPDAIGDQTGKYLYKK